ncbi:MULTISPECIES: hypothetical protein [unclassified Streptomyces]|uniref:hypothetical protein n=1 Tax=unclassified Streptomyces TaxID=2593676 RepID=UPI001BE518AD|nr:MULTISPECIES: hypothetical protein [unclassified Streptomyces]MBT2408923.1 hypothetical protein [Streptomyces sp. ISL-21]MBT2613752.1 hypothetical protein [Streptomyces sp. ISL-87]
MHLPARPGRSTALLLSASLVTVLAGGLAGCSLIDPYAASCEGSEPRLKEMSSLTILDAKPSQASPPAGHTQVETACDDDSSGDAWLSAERLYSSTESKTEILDYYTKAAAADGWKLEENTSPQRAPVDVEGLCFSKGGDGNAMTLTVSFPTGDTYAPAPDFGAGTGFELLVGAEIDGSPTPCWT